MRYNLYLQLGISIEQAKIWLGQVCLMVLHGQEKFQVMRKAEWLQCPWVLFCRHCGITVRWSMGSNYLASSCVSYCVCDIISFICSSCTSRETCLSPRCTKHPPSWGLCTYSLYFPKTAAPVSVFRLTSFLLSHSSWTAILQDDFR